jgi:CDP-diacylglycerol--inositol 3-phosphatidyltransferase
MLNQTSTLGAVLDMVTDRLATAGLMTLLAMQYPRWYLVCIMIVFLDIFSHWSVSYTPSDLISEALSL